MTAIFKITGEKAMRRKLALLGEVLQDRVGVALRGEGEMIMRVSKQVYVPVDLGPLKASGQVEGPIRRRGKVVMVILSFGGAAAPYALEQHENPDYKHEKTQSWKYLEIPLNEAVKGMAVRIAAEVRT